MELTSDFPSLRPGKLEDFMALSSVDVQGRVARRCYRRGRRLSNAFLIEQFADTNLIGTGL
jgi:hypothetical protein